MRGEEVELAKAQRVVRRRVELAQAADELRGVRPLAVVGAEIREEKEDAARGAIALRLVDERERFDRRGARGVPAAGSEEREEVIERGVDALDDGARRVACGECVIDRAGAGKRP